LGSGSFGFVKKAVWIPHGNLPVAIKCIKKKSGPLALLIFVPSSFDNCVHLN
jgi:hypothetical protein